MSTIVKGKDVAVYIYDGGQWKLYACGLSCTLSTSTGFIETSTIGSGKNATFVPTKNEITGSITGITSLQLTNTLSLPELRQKQMSHNLFMMRFERTSMLGATYIDEVNFYIANCTDEGPHDGLNTFSIELKGTGSLTQIFTPTTITPPGEMHYYEYPSNGSGETFFTYAPLIGKTIIGAFRQTNYTIIFAGSPNGTQIKFTTATGLPGPLSTGVASWLIAMEPDETWVIQYQD